MRNHIFTQAVEIIRGDPDKFGAIVKSITTRFQDMRTVADVLNGFVNAWKSSKSPEERVAIAWLLADSAVGSGKPFVDEPLARMLMKTITEEQENNTLNPETLQEWIWGVVFSDEIAVQRLEEAVKAYSQVKPSLGEIEGMEPAHTKTKSRYTGVALALAMLAEHPDWTDKKIAKEIGISRTTLYTWPDFKKAKEILKQERKRLLKGSKNSKTGELEAWQ